MFVGEIKLDRGGFGHNQAAIHQHRHLGSGVELLKVLLLVLTLQQIYRNHLVLQAEFVEQPDDAQGAGWGCSA
jgi:hypothetical protein